MGTKDKRQGSIVLRLKGHWRECVNSAPGDKESPIQTSICEVAPQGIALHAEKGYALKGHQKY